MENPKSMNNSRKREKVGFNVGGAGGIVVVGAAVVAAAIGAAFLAYRDKKRSKQGADRTSQDGIGEKTEKDLHDFGKLEGSSDDLVIQERLNPKNETTEDNFKHEDAEKKEIALIETGDSPTEQNVEAICLSKMIDQNKPCIKEESQETAFGSLIEIQETNPSIDKEESKHKISYDGTTIEIETAKKTVGTSTVDTENNPSYDFSFWNNNPNKHKEIEDGIKEASNKSEERSYDVFELEDEQRNENTFAITSGKSESGNYKQRVENMQTENGKGGEKGGAFAYAGVEVEQNGKGYGRLFEEDETNKVNVTASVVDGQENGKETDEKDEGEEKEQGSVTYIEEEEKVVEKEEDMSIHTETRKGGDKGNTEGENDDKDNGDDISYAELVEDEEANKVNDTTNYENFKEDGKGEAIQSALKGTDEKDEYKEVKGNITHEEVEGTPAEKEEKTAQDEERKGDDSGNTEVEEGSKDNIILKETVYSGTIAHLKEIEKEVEENGIDVVNIGNGENLGAYINEKLAGQDKVGDVTLIDAREENSQKDTDYIQEKDNQARKDEEEEEQDDSKNRQVEEIAVKEEEHDGIRHIEEEEMMMDLDNQDKCRDDIEVKIKAVEKEENKREKGVDDDVDSLEENEKQGEYIIIKEELQENMKLVKVTENEEKREENDGKLLKIEDATIPTPIGADEVESKNEEGNEIDLTEQGAFITKNGVDLEMEKNEEKAGSAYVGIKAEEQNTEEGKSYTEGGKGDKTDDTYNVMHGQHVLQEVDDGDDEIVRKDEVVDEEIDEEEVEVSKAMIEEKVEKIVVAKERPNEAFCKEDIRAENKDTMLKETENDVEQDGVEKSRDIQLSDKINKELSLSHITQEEGIKENGEKGKEQDDIMHAAGVSMAEKELEDTPYVGGGRNVTENEEEDTYRDDGNINMEVKSAKVYGITNIENSLEEEEDETANKELNMVDSEETENVMQVEETMTIGEVNNKNSEERFNKREKGVDDDVDNLEENEKQKGEYIIIKEESQEDMKLVKVMGNEVKREENDGKLLKIEDATIPTPIGADEVESKNEEGNEIDLTEQGAFITKNGVDLEMEKNEEKAESAYVGIIAEEQNTEEGIAYTEVGKGDKTDDTYNVMHGQHILQEVDDGDDEIVRKDKIVDEEIDEEAEVGKATIEEKVEKIGVAKERPNEAFCKEDIRAENKDSMLKETENDVEQDGVEKNKDIHLSDKVNKELSHVRQEEGIEVNREKGKEQDDIMHAVAGVSMAEKELEDTPYVGGRRNVTENEEEDTYRDDSNINMEIKSAKVCGITNIENSLEEEEDETANKELNMVDSEETEYVMQVEETMTVEEMNNKKSEERFNNMKSEVASESFTFQKDDNVEKDDEENEDDTESKSEQEFADHSQIKNSNAIEDAECLMLAKKKTAIMSMAHVSKGLFLLVLAMSIAAVILSIFAAQDHPYYYSDHHLPHFCREIFRILSPFMNQTTEIQ